jgi:hypothetical protein
MINPTGNGNILTVSSDRGTKTQARADDSLGGNRPRESETSTTPTGSDRIEVSQAARIIGQTERAPAARPAGNIESPEQASKLVSHIRQQFQGAGAQALQAQSRMPGEQLAALLQGYGG